MIEGEESPFFVTSSEGCCFVVVAAPAVSALDAAPTVVAVLVEFPSIFGFDDAEPPFPPLPFVPFGGEDLRDEEEFAVKYLCLFPFPSPLPPDLEEKNEKARACCCAACVVVDVDVAAAVEASETVGRAATRRANICKETQGMRRKRCRSEVRVRTFRLALVSGRGTSHTVTAVTQTALDTTLALVSNW